MDLGDGIQAQIVLRGQGIRKACVQNTVVHGNPAVSPKLGAVLISVLQVPDLRPVQKSSAGPGRFLRSRRRGVFSVFRKGLSRFCILFRNCPEGMRVGKDAADRRGRHRQGQDNPPDKFQGGFPAGQGQKQDCRRGKLSSCRRIIDIKSVKSRLRQDSKAEQRGAANEEGGLSAGKRPEAVPQENNRHPQRKRDQEHPAVILIVETGQNIAAGRNQQKQKLRDQGQFQRTEFFPLQGK